MPLIVIFVDADACPVKDEIYEVGSRHRVRVVLVANSRIGVPADLGVEMITVGNEPDAADDWIAAHVEPGDVVVTGDIPLAARCLEGGARVVGTHGRVFTDDSIGGALATRELNNELRERGIDSGGPRAMNPRDRSRFASQLDQLVVASLRETGG